MNVDDPEAESHQRAWRRKHKTITPRTVYLDIVFSVCLCFLLTATPILSLGCVKHRDSPSAVGRPLLLGDWRLEYVKVEGEKSFKELVPIKLWRFTEDEFSSRVGYAPWSASIKYVYSEEDATMTLFGIGMEDASTIENFDVSDEKIQYTAASGMTDYLPARYTFVRNRE